MAMDAYSEYAGDVTLLGHQQTQLRIMTRLAFIVGIEEAERLFNECLRGAELKELRTSQDLLRLTRFMVSHKSIPSEFAVAEMRKAVQAIIKQANSKLTGTIGFEKADQVFQDCLREAGLVEITTPLEMLYFALSMAKKSGIAGIIGRSLKIQAMLDGGASINH